MGVLDIDISPEQCRAARGWLNWSQATLAARTGLGQSTIRDFEKGRHTPYLSNMMSIRDAFEGAGMTFLYDEDDNATGVAWSAESKPLDSG